MQNNYGALLQAYALQAFLRKREDLDVENIDFTTKKHELNNRIFKKRSNCHIVIRLLILLLTCLRYFQLQKKNNRIKIFKQKKFNLSRRYLTVNDLLLNPPKKDIFITGSDQVFQVTGEYLDVYYLNFNVGKGKKIAYAPSFGISEFNDKITNRIKPYLEDFNALSCREQAGADYLSKIMKSEIPVVVDPTMLLDIDEWKNIAENPKYKYKYIFIYDLNGGNNLIEISKSIQKQTGFKIVCLTNKVQKFYPVDKQIYDPGPAEFVGWINNADYVVTDSFHGTLMSVILRKEFFTYIALPKTSSRITNLLKNLHLENRIVDIKTIEEFNVSMFSKINISNFEELAYSSKIFLSNNL